MATTFEEYNFLMELDETGIETKGDVEALKERIREWLGTPEGSIANLPGWGHQLGKLKFEPPGEELEIMAELLITEKLPKDIKDVIVRGVLVESIEIDLVHVTIDFGLGVFGGDVTL